MSRAASEKKPTRPPAARREEDVQRTIRRIERGFKFAEFEKLQKRLGLTQEATARALGINPRTLTRRKHAGRLTPEESERVVRLQRLLDQAVRLFGGKEQAAQQWFTTPVLALGDERPVDMAATEPGAREVEAVIGRLEHGVFL